MAAAAATDVAVGVNAVPPEDSLVGSGIRFLELANRFCRPAAPTPEPSVMRRRSHVLSDVSAPSARRITSRYWRAMRSCSPPIPCSTFAVALLRKRGLSRIGPWEISVVLARKPPGR